MKVEVPALGSPALLSLTVKQQLKKDGIDLESTELRYTQNDDHIHSHIKRKPVQHRSGL